MRKVNVVLGLLILFSLSFSLTLQAQFYKTLEGDPNERKKNVHSGNQIRTTFFNYGLVGRINNAEDFGGEWPINTARFYIGDISIMVGAEVQSDSGRIITPMTVSDGPRGSNEFNPNDPNDFWGWEPLPGFANPDTTSVAMSHLPNTWPTSWPDREGDMSDPGWREQWNGFFGKDQFNADQESYWWMDDYTDREFMLSDAFFPDSTDRSDNNIRGSRGGLGLLSSVRGFQWSQALAQNTLFWLYEVTNIGTTNFDKVVFGMIVGTTIGGDGDTNDDNSKFAPLEDLTYSWDNDLVGGTGWFPVDMLGYAFLESPGNFTNGIDDDNDGEAGGGDEIDESILLSRVVQVGDPVVVIDYTTPRLERSVINFPPDGITIEANGTVIRIEPNSSIREMPFNNIDDNLNGLIDENTEIADNGVDDNQNGLIDEPNPQIGLKYINYLTGNGTDNLLMDEGRNDGIDNDGDWNAATDDVGLDGQPDTGDEGEGDGIPTSGFRIGAGGEAIDTGLPGEPNIDKTDIDESDQIGLTSFFFFQPFNLVRLFNDNQLWETLRPGFFDDGLENADGDFIYGTAYFPLKPQQTERISLAFFFTEWRTTVNSTLANLIRTKETVQTIYNNDYNFAKAPVLPTLTGVAGDNNVKLYWDSEAEFSFDRLSLVTTGDGFDFEGYKVYRATFPTFDEFGTVTNVFGNRVADVAVAQYDLDNEWVDFFPAVDQELGSVFYLGENSGLVHTFDDSSAQNGFTYFYAVTAYDRGILSENNTLQPSETSKFAAITASGEVQLAQNVVEVRPEAPTLGYVGPQTSELIHESGDGSGEVAVIPVDPLAVQEANDYEISFNDTIYLPAPDVQILRETTDFTVINRTTGDTLVANSPQLDIDATVFDGIQLHIMNDEIRTLPSQVVWNDTTSNILASAGWGRLAFLQAQGRLYPANYQLEVTADGQGDNSAGINLFPLPPNNPIATNIRIKNVSEDRYVSFNFYDIPLNEENPGKLDHDDLIVLFEGAPHFSREVATYQLVMAAVADDPDAILPSDGNVLTLPVQKPFLDFDLFGFSTTAPSTNTQQAANDLSKVKVVPNPYIATAAWEPRNNFTTGRGDRSIHFNHLPAKCTIRIFNVRGELVDIIEHDSELTDGSANWDLLSIDNIEIAYGVYIYHIDAPGVGQTTGKFAVIK